MSGWHSLCRWFDSLSIRERLLITLTLLVFLLLPGYVVLLEPVMIQQAGLQIRIDRLSAANQERTRDIALLQQQTPHTLNDQLAEQVTTLQQSLEQQNQRDASSTRWLLAPQDAEQLLQLFVASDLHRSGAVRLQGLEKLPARPIMLSISNENNPQLPSAPAGLYQHPFEATLIGDTSALINFLAEIEQQSLPIRIEQMEWQYGKPESQLQLRLYSYGLDTRWLTTPAKTGGGL